MAPSGTMFTSLLVGLDGSFQSEVALSQAIKVGQRFRARLVLAHVSPPPGQTGEMALGAPWMEFTPGTVPASRYQHEEAARAMLEESAGAVPALAWRWRRSGGRERCPTSSANSPRMWGSSWLAAPESAGQRIHSAPTPGS